MRTGTAGAAGERRNGASGPGAPVRGALRRAARLDSRLLPHRTAVESQSVLALSKLLGRPLDVAVLRLDGLGDSMMSIPLVLALRDSQAVRQVTLIAPPAVGSLFRSVPGLQVELLRLNTLASPTTRDARIGKLLAQTVVGQIAAHRAGAKFRDRFDLVVMPRYDSDRGYNAFAFALGTGALVAGHDAKSRSSGSEPHELIDRTLLSIKAADPRPGMHETERALSLSDALGLSVRPVSGCGRTLFDLTSEPPSSRTVVVAPGATNARRIWPLSRWRCVVERLLRAEAVDQVVFVGSPDERVAHEAVLADFGSRAITVAGDVPLPELPTIISGARLFIGADSGPAHVASSLDVPALVLSCHPRGADCDHLNSPSRFGPWSTRSESLRPAVGGDECMSGCTYDAPHCILGITSEEVVSAAERMLAADDLQP